MSYLLGPFFLLLLYVNVVQYNTTLDRLAKCCTLIRAAQLHSLQSKPEIPRGYGGGAGSRLSDMTLLVLPPHSVVSLGKKRKGLS